MGDNMIEVVALDGQVTTYDGETGTYRVDDDGHVAIFEEINDRGHTRMIAVHAAGTWAIARKVTA